MFPKTQKSDVSLRLEKKPRRSVHFGSIVVAPSTPFMEVLDSGLFEDAINSIKFY